MTKTPNSTKAAASARRAARSSEPTGPAGGALVLIVDDDRLFVDSVIDAIGIHRPDLRRVGAPNGLEALKILDREEVSLVVTDLKMPGLDGFGLLAEMVHRHSEVPTLVTTAYGTPEKVEQATELGALQTLGKPVDLRSFLDLVDQVLAEPVRVRGLSLAGFAQLLVQEKKTGVLRVVHAGSQEGTLGFLEGELVDATLGEVHGDDAVLEILEWDRPRLDLLPGRPLGRTIASSLQHLLLERALQDDLSTRELHLPSREEMDEMLDPGAAANPAPAPTARSQTVAGSLGDAVGDASAFEPASSRDDAATRREDLPPPLDALVRSVAAQPGVLGVAVGRLATGEVLHAEGDGVDIETSARGSFDVFRTKIALLRRLGSKDHLDEIIVTLGGQYHLSGRLDRTTTERARFFHLVVDREVGNLGFLRLTLDAGVAALREAEDADP